MVRVKICGITTLQGAQAAVDAGADALGFVFAQSSRRVTPEQARKIIIQLPPFVCKVGVFVNSERQEIKTIADYCGLDVLQLHGEESPQDCQGWHQQVIKAFHVKDQSFMEDIPRYRVAAYLLDTCLPYQRGGTGISFDWEQAQGTRNFGPVILAGGIKAENVAEAVRKVRPYAIDVSSGVETDGKKDPQKIKLLLSKVRRINDELTGY